MSTLNICIQEKQNLITGEIKNERRNIFYYLSSSLKQNKIFTRINATQCRKNISINSNIYSLKVYFRLYSVVLSIGVSSMFMCALDSVADNILPSALPYLKKVLKSKNNSYIYWEQIVSSRIYGLAVGCILTILISNRFSRKWPMFWATVMCLVGALMSAFIKHGYLGLHIAVLGRFLNGIGSGLSQVIGSVMIAEIPSKQHRGTLLATLTVWSCIGELFGMTISLKTFLGTSKLWQYSLSMPALILIPALICIYIAPDSPRYLYEIGDIDGCEKSLKFYQHQLDIPKSLSEIKNEIKCIEKKSLYDSDEEKSSDSSNLEMNRPNILLSLNLYQVLKLKFYSTAFLKPLLIGTFVQTFVHLNDWMWIYYSTNIFQNVGLSTKAAMNASVYMSIPQAFVSIGLLFFFENFKRKKLLVVPTTASIILSLLASFGLFINTGFFCKQKMWFWMPIIASLDLVAAAVASESAYTIVPEIFCQNDRVLGTAFVGIIQNLFGGFISSYILTIINNYGVQYVLLPFCIINVIYITIFQIIVPETCNATFHEIYLKIQKKKFTMPNFNKLTKFIQIFGSKKGNIKFIIIIIFQIFVYIIMLHYLLNHIKKFI
ncbi:General substrate transporter family and Major facilitator superfamily domain, general substrate transporter and Major facilitator superfamily domain-containing protein [Strongyloides ratti]|uniref:General substrate transporter family and Major facilitator superfamily domain, general substrate transporter and Major facilitator superfamily domain-containing protein n=1 Tax=Strongyloides ratti TaxID=34506 RepID=A0A090LLX9_STRRB|nr:General substrate transporter family and Major facilitator superfamily domain, general substrate transporter and Major facilitator superfamily domain-containing protein [Strongyloides ratti]CEF70701.1 General substrate transporter family and Major facilitator superfamily domain, general substrate transporter and Major facilitator superfamily domain-containing protein [Strongyloides ratti]